MDIIRIFVRKSINFREIKEYKFIFREGYWRILKNINNSIDSIGSNLRENIILFSTSINYHPTGGKVVYVGIK